MKFPGNVNRRKRPRGTRNRVAVRGGACSKNTCLSSLYHRITARGRANRAIFAVAHRILTISYHLLKHKQVYVELGPHYYEERKQIAKQAVHKLESLGYKGTVEKTLQTTPWAFCVFYHFYFRDREDPNFWEYRTKISVIKQKN